ncbi:MAG: hypothetical protein RLY97_1933 [Pseudomonadota bacterium]
MIGSGDELGTELGQTLRDGIAEKASEMAGGLRDGIAEKASAMTGGLTDGITTKASEMTGGLTDGITEKAGAMAGGLRDNLTDSAEAMLRGVKGRAKSALNLDEPAAAEGEADAPAAPADAQPDNRIVDDAVADRRLDLHEDDRLPWLEAEDDDDGYAGVDGKRVFGFVLAGLALLATIVGGIWWGTHRKPADVAVADGSTIAAPEGDYKSAPKDPGGKTYAGTGDSSFAVSQGQHPTSHLASGGDVNAVNSAANAAANAANDIKGGAAGVTPPVAVAHGGAAPTAADPKLVYTGAGAGSGAMVQVGAFSTHASAETAWAKLSQQYSALSGFHHRIVEGQADIGTVHRLQAMAGSDAAASGLCSKLKSAGLPCQVKH